jgi:penicillin-binding protein 1A
MARRDAPRRGQDGEDPAQRSRAPSTIGRWFRRLMIWGIGIVLLLGLGITGAVLVTARSLPSYDKLKSSQAGQMIVVRANDGSEIVTLGPSYGKWIPITASRSR